MSGRPFPRYCTLCDTRIRFKQRLCETHAEEFKDQQDADWMRGLITEAEYQYNVARRDYRNRVESLEKLAGRV